MLHTNLSTRPFYNVRLVQAALAAFALLVLIMTLFNVVQIVRLTSSQRTLGARAAEADAEAGRLRDEAVQLRARIDPKELAIVAAAAREANTVIDQRVFSWTDLFTQFEATLPEDVRITAVSPRNDDGRFIVSIGVEARRVEDLDAFIEALEMTGQFHNVLPTDQVSDEGLVEAVVEGYYVPRPLAAGAAASASPPDDAPGGARE